MIQALTFPTAPAKARLRICTASGGPIPATSITGTPLEKDGCQLDYESHPATSITARALERQIAAGVQPKLWVLSLLHTSLQICYMHDYKCP